MRCEAELPQLEALIDTYGDDVGMAVVVMGAPPPGVRGGELEIKAKRPYVVLADGGKGRPAQVARQYGASSGHWYVVDADRKVLACDSTMEEALDALEKRTGKSPKEWPEIKEMSLMEMEGEGENGMKGGPPGEGQTEVPGSELADAEADAKEDSSKGGGSPPAELDAQPAGQEGG